MKFTVGIPKSWMFPRGRAPFCGSWEWHSFKRPYRKLGMFKCDLHVPGGWGPFLNTPRIKVEHWVPTNLEVWNFPFQKIWVLSNHLSCLVLIYLYLEMNRMSWLFNGGFWKLIKNETVAWTWNDLDLQKHQLKPDTFFNTFLWSSKLKDIHNNFTTFSTFASPPLVISWVWFIRGVMKWSEMSPILWKHLKQHRCLFHDLEKLHPGSPSQPNFAPW